VALSNPHCSLPLHLAKSSAPSALHVGSTCGNNLHLGARLWPFCPEERRPVPTGCAPELPRRDEYLPFAWNRTVGRPVKSLVATPTDYCNGRHPAVFQYSQCNKQYIPTRTQQQCMILVSYCGTCCGLSLEHFHSNVCG
jgi:hypothetical protein